MEVIERDQTFVLNFKYDARLFDASTIERMCEHTTLLLDAALKDAARPLRQQGMLSDRERYHCLELWNDTATVYPSDRCVHELIAEQAARRPEAIALRCGDESLTYEALNRKSATLASYLRIQGVGPGQLVGLCVDRSMDMVIGLLGILRSGAAYVPLDPLYPANRLSYMLQDSQCALVLVQARLNQKIEAIASPAQKIVLIDEQWAEIEDLSKSLGDMGPGAQPEATATPWGV